MARASKKDAERHRQEIVAASARLFRERGIGGVSVPELMAAAGLTHGGFYGHFPSKSALAAEAIAEASREIGSALAATVDAHRDDRQAAFAALVATYMSPHHRDDPGEGCPVSALIDYARDGCGTELGTAYHDSVETMIAAVQNVLPEGSGREDALAILATMVGGLLLSRACTGTPLSDEFLIAVRRNLGVSEKHDAAEREKIL
ncbi:transcriptional regulator, TetR family [Kaistia soli DSM 19436]|uniref:Transcriptional regulator, TetR family n=1 Tax=Kaistia soli DSM 19436 TaxID=1122133 RepID=A0A1M5AIF7_9HYPH|nr:TetR/AcrR family transcriptional regulator [Kaistia soli]SHF29682.1 transcriptional regulator, TetR family [Kaistia soli DSM 19436]